MIPISVQDSQFNLINDFSTNSQINIDKDNKLSDVVENNVSNRSSRNHSESTLTKPKQDPAGYDIDLFTNSISSDMLTDDAISISSTTPTDGDWILDTDQTFSDQDIVINGNLQITNGANITFERSTVSINSSFDGEFEVFVENNARLNLINNSVLNAENVSHSFSVVIHENTKFRSFDSTIRDVNPSILVNSSDVIIQRSELFNMSKYAFQIESAGVVEVGYSNITSVSTAFRLNVTDYNQIYNNNITSTSYYPIQFTENSDNNVIENNNLTSLGQLSVLFVDSNNNYFRNNSMYGEDLWNIWLDRSDSNTFLDNRLLSDGSRGIYLTESLSNIFKNNTITSGLAGNNAEAIGLYQSSNDNTIENNTIIGRTDHGILINFSDDNKILSNNITSITSTSNDGMGIFLATAQRTNITQNDITSKEYRGIDLYQSNSSIIYNNTVLAGDMSGAIGVYVDSDTYFSEISHNTIRSVGYRGMVLLSSHNNTIYSNYIEAGNLMGSEVGLIIFFSTYNNFTDNTILSSAFQGISFYDSSYNLVDNNTITAGDLRTFSKGAHINAGSSYNTFRNNDISGGNSDTNSYGMHDELSDNNLYEYNTVTALNATAFYVDRSSKITIRNNIIFSFDDTGQSALYFDQTSDSVVQNNELTSNTGYSVFIFDAENNEIINNDLSNYEGSTVTALLGLSEANNTIIKDNSFHPVSTIAIELTSNSNFNNITDNEINTFSVAISISTGMSNLISSNNISSDKASGIILLNGSTLANDFLYNNITVNSPAISYAFELVSAINSTFRANNINVEGVGNGAFLFSNANGSLITENQIILKTGAVAINNEKLDNQNNRFEFNVFSGDLIQFPQLSLDVANNSRVKFNSTLSITETNTNGTILFKWVNEEGDYQSSDFKFNRIGIHEIIILAYDDQGNSFKERYVYEIFEEVQPIFINTPDDINFTEGTTGNTISWTISDDFPSNYSIYQNNTLLNMGEWLDNDEVELQLDNLVAGTYNFTILIEDSSGNTNTDSVIVTVNAVDDGGDGGDNTDPFDSNVEPPAEDDSLLLIAVIAITSVAIITGSVIIIRRRRG